MLDAFMQARSEEGAIAAVLDAGRHGDPFSVLGLHRQGDGWVLRAFLPGADRVEVLRRGGGDSLAYLQQQELGLFTGHFRSPESYLLRITWGSVIQETEDPYSFGALLSHDDLRFAAEGQHWRMHRPLGAFPTVVDGVAGVGFAVWAPNARRVSVVGNFNAWDGRRHPMRLRHEAGIWELFIPRLGAGEIYKYEIIGVHGDRLPLKADPFARQSECPPATGSVVADAAPFAWTDQSWMAGRGNPAAENRPISIYEVHAGSWLRPEGRWQDQPDWEFLADRLVPYVAELGFSHIELLPIMEHPFGGSWGYQPLSLFAPTARYGAPEGFAAFVDRCHRENIGVILDWVPGHFPTDAHGLADFDGTHLFEHADPKEGFHQDWNTLIFNLGRREVRGYLIASALHWLEHFHIDGLRVDAVASLLYRDYSRREGEWVPNVHGGRENLEAISFLRELNEIVHRQFPAVAMIAEESTAWPGVTAPVAQGGLGFGFKWNMGWMHDTLSYLQREPIYRTWHHNDMTFGLAYAFSEKFVLPLSHDEVVHGKGSLWGRAPGDEAAKLATLRAYFAFMWTHPGKKLLFMGGEFGQRREWNHDGELDWHLLEQHGHAGLQRLVGDLNRLYRQYPAFHASDADPAGFAWIIGNDGANSVFGYLRRHGGEKPMLCILNMTPVARDAYRIGVPVAGAWREILNTDAAFYGGGDRGNQGIARVSPIPSHGSQHSLELYLPPLSMLILTPEA